MTNGQDLSPIACTSIETSLGSLFLARTARGLCFLGLRPEGAEAELAGWRDRWEPGAPILADAGALAEEAQQLQEYTGGERREFDLELDLRGTEFQLSVWRELQEIPFGVTLTYGQLAARLGSANASRAVGAANGANPVAIVVPCHRVVATTGLGGYGGGLELKRKLLELEGVLLFS